MKKLFVYSALILALGACKSSSTDTKKDDKSSSSSSSSAGYKSSTSTSTDGTNSGTSGSTSSSGSGSWSSADKTMFMKTCTDAAAAKGMSVSKAKDYCSCMLDKIEVAYPTSSEAGKMTINETTEMAKECLK